MVWEYLAQSLFSNDTHGRQTLPGLTYPPYKICLFVQYMIDEQDWHLTPLQQKKKSLVAKSGHVEQLFFLSWLTITEVMFTVQC